MTNKTWGRDENKKQSSQLGISIFLPYEYLRNLIVFQVAFEEKTAPIYLKKDL